jgi:hypothetical protein
MGFKVGDKIIITNAGGIMFGRDYFKDGDVTEVLQVEDYPFSPGEQCIDVAVPEDKVDKQTDFIDGKPALYIAGEEFAHIAKILPDNKGGS